MQYLYPQYLIPIYRGAGSTNFSFVAVPMKVVMALLHLLPSSEPCCVTGVGRLDIIHHATSGEGQVRRQ